MGSGVNAAEGIIELIGGGIGGIAFIGGGI